MLLPVQVYVAITINTNPSALRVAGQVAKSSDLLARTYERLSSGMRITRPGDDSAGLAISSTLNVHTRVLAQASRNISDAISYFSIADSALDQLTAITQRQEELAAQAANGTFSVAQRRALSKEANALVDEFNRIVQVSSFNGQVPLAQNGATFAVQADLNSAGALLFSVGGEIDISVGTGAFASQTSTAIAGITNQAFADFNRDGKIDLAATVGTGTQIRLGNGDGTFGATFATLGDSNAVSAATGDFTGDGITDIVTASNAKAVIFRGNGDGTFTQLGNIVGNYSGVFLADGNGDGRTDLFLAGGAEHQLYLGNGDGTFGAATIKTFAAQISAPSVVADFNNDNMLDFLAPAGIYDRLVLVNGTSNGLGSISNIYQTDYGTFSGLVAADFNLDGNMDAVSLSSTGLAQLLSGNGDGTFTVRSLGIIGASAALAAGDVNGDGLTDLVTTGGQTKVALGKGDGTFAPAITSAFAPAYNNRLVDINGDGVNELLGASAGNFTAAFQIKKQTSNMPYLNITTASGARDAMSVIADTRNRLQLERSVVGAQMSRLNIAASMTGEKMAQFSASAQRITDVDVAQASAELLRLQILQQSGAALLAQSNQAPALALELLRS